MLREASSRRQRFHRRLGTGRPCGSPGQTGDLPDGTVLEPVEEQTRQALANVEGCLSAAGASWSDVIEMTMHSVDLRCHADVMFSVAGEFLASPFPAWTAIGVAELWEGAVFEVKCVAVVQPQTSARSA